MLERCGLLEKQQEKSTHSKAAWDLHWSHAELSAQQSFYTCLSLSHTHPITGDTQTADSSVCVCVCQKEKGESHVTSVLVPPVSSPQCDTTHHTHTLTLPPSILSPILSPPFSFPPSLSLLS